MKPKTTLILIASEKDARFLENAGVGKGIHQMSHISVSDIADQLAEYSDAPTTGRASGGSGRYHIEAATSPREFNRAAFAKHVMGVVADKMQRGGFDRMILCAAPAMLGELRHDLSDGLRSKLHAELDKDLAAIPTAELEKHFSAVLAV